MHFSIAHSYASVTTTATTRRHWALRAATFGSRRDMSAGLDIEVGLPFTRRQGGAAAGRPTCVSGRQIRWLPCGPLPF